MDERTEKIYRGNLIVEIVVISILTLYLGLLTGAAAYQEGGNFFESLFAIPDRMCAIP